MSNQSTKSEHATHSKHVRSPGASRSALHRSGVWPLVTAQEMRDLDRATIEGQGIPGEILMESAGRALFAATCDLHRSTDRRSRPIRVLCGAGHNGGDGFVLVRHLHAEGRVAEAILLGEPEALPADAARNWARLAATGAPHRAVDVESDPRPLCEGASVLVDAIFGTGLSRAIEGALAGWVEAIGAARGSGVRVLSVDVPSGICADTGRILGVAVDADRTVTISLPKIGLALEPGRSHAGAITVARVGIADPPADRLPRVELWNARAAAARFPERPRAGHKGSFGHVLVAGGSPGKVGAAALSARGAARAGAGLVTVAYPRGLDREIGGVPVEAMSAAVGAPEATDWTANAEKPLLELAHARDVVALGPGLGRSGTLREVIPRLADAIDRPLVLDADGLHALSGQLEGLRERRAATVLTPHPGEAANLLGVVAAEVNADRVGAARELAFRSGAIAVLKGAATVVADSLGRANVVPTGGPALATGGTGDVLTGVVAALLARGLEPFEAASLAAWWHGAAADHALGGNLPLGLRASEVADALPACASALVREHGGVKGGAGEDLELRFPGS